jgi:menaquinol-cytochrome c reductase iron-sulfur subunit
VSSPGGNEQPHVPPPSLWPVGFAVGIAVLLTGLVVGWPIVLLGVILAVGFGFLWIRDLRTEGSPLPEQGTDVETRPGAAPAAAGTGPALPLATEEEVERFPRSKFLEGATLGVGGVIGGLVTVPALGFAVLPAFIADEPHEADVGPLDAFPQDEWRVTTFLADPGQGEVSRRTAYIRYNGVREGQPSFTILSSSCVHLGCPVQPNGPIAEDAAEEEQIGETLVRRIPTTPAGFGCPCHGGAYDIEGRRTAGPPVRAMDRYAYVVRGGRLLLREPFSVGEVRAEGADAVIVRYGRAIPGVHVDGISRILYPIPSPPGS